MPQHMVAITFHTEHIIPLAHGGKDTEDNLWLACPLCNLHKGMRVMAVDPDSAAEVPLFNPRTQNWHDHFVFDQDNAEIVGITPTGRATVDALRLNLPAQIEARRWWVELGQYPPAD